MILQKEFYFIRHGQTDYNVSSNEKLDHKDVSLNVTGLQQARSIEPLIARLPINSICYSPLKRAQQTKDAVSKRLRAFHQEMADLGECSRVVWNDMISYGIDAHCNGPRHVRNFIDRVRNGMNEALSLQGPVLIIAHGGVHWAICCLMGIEDHDWIIDNCLPVHFFLHASGQWKAEKLKGPKC